MLVFNPIDFIDKLEKTGVSHETAKVQAQAIVEILDNDLSTKRNLKELEVKIETLRRDIKEMELRMTIKLGLLLTVGVVAIAAMIKFL